MTVINELGGMRRLAAGNNNSSAGNNSLNSSSNNGGSSSFSSSKMGSSSGFGHMGKGNISKSISKRKSTQSRNDIQSDYNDMQRPTDPDDNEKQDDQLDSFKEDYEYLYEVALLTYKTRDIKKYEEYKYKGLHY